MTEGRRWTAAVAIAAATAWVSAPGELEAQRAELIPQIGFFSPLASLGTAEDEGGISFDLGERERGFAYGLAVQFGGIVPVGVRGSVLFGTGSDVPVTGPGCPEGECTLENNLRLLTGALIIRPFPTLVVIRPYALAGGGWKRYGFDEAEAEALGLDPALEDHTHTAWQIGLGTELGLGAAAVVVELNDFISGFDVADDLGEGKTQHDIFLTVGLRL